MNLGTYRLGPKTFWLFVLDSARRTFALGFLLISIVLLIGSFTVAESISPDLPGYAALGGGICLALFIIAFGIAFLIAWLKYKNYEYVLDENGLKVRQGILTKEEVAIPYRQIQNVDVTRTLTDQMLGLSRLEILSAGHEDTNEPDETEGILPSLDKTEAEDLQSELMKRANIEKVESADK